MFLFLVFCKRVFIMNNNFQLIIKGNCTEDELCTSTISLDEFTEALDYSGRHSKNIHKYCTMKSVFFLYNFRIA